MHKSRIWIASIAAFGLLTPFLPWVNVMGLLGVSGTEVGQGWLVFIIFAAAIALTLTGSRVYPLDAGRKGGLAVLGLAAVGFGIWKAIEIKNGTIQIAGQIGEELKRQGGDTAGELGRELGRGMMSMFGSDQLVEMSFGVYAVIVAGAALVIAVLLSKQRA
ncbi:MAG: hypothetical protein M4D80_22205 [Myxococcota bacterium]|nr:hypothetical protein [Deltaproteobacteria bacterium]MDQ3337884.1 hypothetical protein [Myxococcota bacterium]